MLSFAAARQWFAPRTAPTEFNILRSKRAAVVTLRWLLVIAAGYLMLFSGSEWPGVGVSAIVVALMASNVIIGRLPDRVVEHAGFDAILLVLDTTLLTAGFYLARTISPDFYLLYFLIVFLAGVSENLRSVVMGSLLASGAYLALVWSNLATAPTTLPQVSLPLRIFFIFAVALFYGFLVERIRVDRETRQSQYVAQLEAVNVKLRELVELRQAFVGSVSHELRSPLNAMLGYMDLVRDGSAGEVKGPALRYIEKAYHRGRHLLRLVEELLSFSDISNGRSGLQPSSIDVAALVDKIRASAEQSARAKGLDFSVEIDPEVGTIDTDAGKLVQVLLHVVTNAIKFTDEGLVHLGAIRRTAALETGWEGPIIEFVVRDTGPGIPVEAQQAVFEEFRQLDGAATRRHEGIGLGLSVCRGLVQLLRGAILLNSTPGRGTTVTIRLPVNLNTCPI